MKQSKMAEDAIALGTAIRSRSKNPNHFKQRIGDCTTSPEAKAISCPLELAIEIQPLITLFFKFDLVKVVD